MVEGDSVDVLALGRLEQAAQRPRAGEEPLIVNYKSLSSDRRKSQHCRLQPRGDELYAFYLRRQRS